MSKENKERQPVAVGKKWAWMIVGTAVVVAAYIVVAPDGSRIPGASYRDGTVVARGEALYRLHCAVCHGPSGAGENPQSPMGGVKDDGSFLAPALDGTGHAWHHAPDQLFGIIKNGSPAAGSKMLGWAGKMSDEEIDAVMAYFRSLWPEAIQSRYGQMFGN